MLFKAKSLKTGKTCIMQLDHISLFDPEDHDKTRCTLHNGLTVLLNVPFGMLEDVLRLNGDFAELPDHMKPRMKE